MDAATQWPNPLVVTAEHIVIGDADHRWTVDRATGVVTEVESRGRASQPLADGWKVTGRGATPPKGAKVEGPIVGITRVGSDWWVATRDSLLRFGSRPDKQAHTRLRALAAMPDGVAWIDAEGLTAGTCRLPVGEGTPWLAASDRWLVVSGSSGSLVVDRSSCQVVTARDGRGGRVVVDGEHVWTWDGVRLWRAALPSLAPEPAFTPFAVVKDLGGAQLRGRTVLSAIPWALPGAAWWLGDRFVGLDGGRLRVWSGEGKILADVDGAGLVDVTGADRAGDRVVVTDGARVLALGAAGAQPTTWTRARVVSRVRATEGGVWVEERELVGGAWARSSATLAPVEVEGAPEPAPGVTVVAPHGEVGALPQKGLDGAGRARWGLPAATESLRCAPIPARVGEDRFDWTFERATLVTAAVPYPERLPEGLDVLETRERPVRELPTLVIGQVTAAAVATACGRSPVDDAILVEPGGSARRFATADDAVLAYRAAAAGWGAGLFPTPRTSVDLGAVPAAVLPQADGSVVVTTKLGSARVALDGTRWRVPGEVRPVGAALVLGLGRGTLGVDPGSGRLLGPVAPPDEAAPRAWGWDCTDTCRGPRDATVATPLGDAEWLLYDGDLVVRKGRRSLLHLERVDAVVPLGADRLVVRVGSRWAPWQLVDTRGEVVGVLPAGDLALAGGAAWIAEDRYLTAF